MKLDAQVIEDCCRSLLPGYDAWEHDGSFHFDHAKALDACEFFQEVLTLTTARWAGQRFDLQPWQVAIIGNVHGWRTVGGARRYRKCLITTARKSSMSHVAAGLGLYHLFAEGEADPSIVIAAGNSEQAGIIKAIAAKMVKQEPELARRAEVLVKSIRNVSNGGSMRFINSATDTKHGTNESLVILDELHVIKDPELANVLETSMLSRESPLSIYTTTAGSDPGMMWAKIFDHSNKVRSGEVADPEFLPCMWQADDDDDVASPATWRKAQPNLGVSVSEADYTRAAREAQAAPYKLQGFKQLLLNLSTESHAAWIDYAKWLACAGPAEPAPGAIAYAGCDLGSTQDTSAVVFVSPTAEGKLLVKPFAFLPEDNASGLFKRQKRDKAPYRYWADAGHLILTPGNVIDFNVVAQTIIEQAKRYDLREVQMDAHAASAVATLLQAAGIKVQYVGQGWSLSQATKATEAMVYAGTLTHPNNPVLNWAMSGAEVHTDAQENIWPHKGKSTRRIDAAVALVMAVNSWKFGADREVAAEAIQWVDQIYVV